MWEIAGIYTASTGLPDDVLAHKGGTHTLMYLPFLKSALIHSEEQRHSCSLRASSRRWWHCQEKSQITCRHCLSFQAVTAHGKQPEKKFFFDVFSCVFLQVVAVAGQSYITRGHKWSGVKRTCRERNTTALRELRSQQMGVGSVPSFLTGFLWCSGEASFHCTAVRVVSTTNTTFIFDFGRANLSVAANFLKRTIKQGGISFLICNCDI